MNNGDNINQVNANANGTNTNQPVATPTPSAVVPQAATPAQVLNTQPVNAAPTPAPVQTNSDSNSGDPNALKPMEGVKVAPISNQPIDASKNNSSTSPAFTNKATNEQTPKLQDKTTTSRDTKENKEDNPDNTGTDENKVEDNVQPPKKGISTFTVLLLLAVIGLGTYIYFIQKASNQELETVKYNCTPITSSKKEVKLDLNSTLVKDLYRKVYTNIREDLAQPEFNDNMKLYLAYRQIADANKYNSNCNLFNPSGMEPFICDETVFTPKAFKPETLQLEYIKLFGEKSTMPSGNIRLGDSSCIGGYQYIAEREEYVEGFCQKQTNIMFKVKKDLKSATSTRNTIILKEKVEYMGSEQLKIPDTLKNGTYDYIFRLDMNYNYVLIDKIYENK